MLLTVWTCKDSYCGLRSQPITAIAGTSYVSHPIRPGTCNTALGCHVTDRSYPTRYPPSSDSVTYISGASGVPFERAGGVQSGGGKVLEAGAKCCSLQRPGFDVPETRGELPKRSGITRCQEFEILQLMHGFTNNDGHCQDLGDERISCSAITSSTALRQSSLNLSLNNTICC
jgi:hypothetical protein